MMPLAALFASYAAFSALCLGMDGHHREVFGRAPSPRRAQWLRGAGWLLLAASFALAVTGGPQGVVTWVGMLTASALALVLLLSYHPRHVAPLGWLACGAALALLGAALWH
ncbi:DUF3325 domain-containing protein [Chitiniphilus shinanonensis]|uniref:DUF3325 domain-containing protein n=1 Tax=Chitiniphilus shinanonensis TaxID=553088 RepID=UPI0030592111